MLFTYNQLKKFLNKNISPTEVADILTRIGLEIEDVIDHRTPLADFIVGEIVECKPHPDSDHLHLLKVNTGTEVLDIVCGAPNARAGLKGILARVGNIIPHDGTKLKKGMVRGAVSCGMMCSGAELCINEDHDGIIDLDPSLVSAGDSAIDALEKCGFALDIVYDGNVLPNHPDYLGVMGIARDLATAVDFADGAFVSGYTATNTFIAPKVAEIASSTPCPISVDNQILDDAREYDLCYISGVVNGLSPDWLSHYLTSVNMKSISALVDITNYCLHNYNRPLHVFDADKIKGNLVINHATDGEVFTGLDGNTYTLSDGDIVIRDDSGIISLAGIMGGLSTSCTMDTKNILVESAYFEPTRIRRTAKRLKIETDSKFRFERGVDPSSTIWGLNLAVNMMMELCGGTPSKILTTGKCSYTPYTVDFPVSYFARRVGFDIPKSDMIAIMQSLGCAVADNGDILGITPPSYRADILAPEDVSEELVRIYGFDNLPAVSVKPENNGQNSIVDINTVHRTKLPRLLANRGLTEVYTWSFMDEAKQLSVPSDKTIRILNPIASDLNVLRQSIIPNLLDGVKNNLARGIQSTHIFELGPTFFGSLPQQQNLTVSAVRQGASRIHDWHNSAISPDIYDVKNDVFAIFELFGVNASSVKFTTDNLPEYLNPYRSARILFAGKTIGYFGEIHPLTLRRFGIKNTSVVAFELNLDLMPQPKKKGTAKKALHLSDLLPLTRDFAVIIDDSVAGDTILSKVCSTNRDLITDATIFDIYKGDKLPSGKKSVAIHLTITQRDKTLSGDEINDIFTKAIDSVIALGGELRDK